MKPINFSPSLFTACIAASLMLLSCGVFAADRNAQYSNSGGWNWSADLGTMQFDKAVAAHQYIDNSATTLGLAAEYFASESSMVYTLGVEIIFYGDNASFSQDTNQGNKSSSASGGMLFVEAGPQYHFGANNDFYFTARAGFGGMTSSSRSIDYCTNCYEEDINVDAGPYGLLGIGHSFNSFNLGVQYRQFFSGDVNSNLSLKISTVF